jgi:hypothetical protein
MDGYVRIDAFLNARLPAAPLVKRFVTQNSLGQTWAFLSGVLSVPEIKSESLRKGFCGSLLLSANHRLTIKPI